MSAYQVRFRKDKYEVIKLDGFRTVGQFDKGHEAQRYAAILNQQHQEQVNRQQTAIAQLNKQKAATEPVKSSESTPNPPPGQGVHY